MSTELEAAVARLKYVSRDEEIPAGLAAGAKLSEDVAAVLAAMSSPPADDVREALAYAMHQLRHPCGEPPVDFDYERADAILSDPRFPVRLRGTVTDDEEPTVRLAMKLRKELTAAGYPVPMTTLRPALEAARGARVNAENTTPTNHTDRSTT